LPNEPLGHAFNFSQHGSRLSPERQALAPCSELDAKAALHTLDVVADRGYFNGEEILACEQADIAVTLPKPMTSGAKSEGRAVKPRNPARGGPSWPSFARVRMIVASRKRMISF
jgi:hypothetical protein